MPTKATFALFPLDGRALARSSWRLISPRGKSVHYRAHRAMSLEQIQREFLSAPRFAVVGASKDQTKYGTKVLKWYQARNLAVTPVHPKEAELEGLKTVVFPELPSPTETAVSIITPPKVTLGILKTAKELGVPTLWLQPGAEDDSVRAYIEEAGLQDHVILGGPCILVEGE